MYNLITTKDFIRYLFTVFLLLCLFISGVYYGESRKECKCICENHIRCDCDYKSIIEQFDFEINEIGHVKCGIGD